MNCFHNFRFAISDILYYTMIVLFCSLRINSGACAGIGSEGDQISIAQNPEIMLAACANVRSFDALYCKCAYRVSSSLVDNDPIFNLFVNSAGKSENKIEEMYSEMIDSTVYNSKTFSSRKEKMEYIEGKFLLFAHRLHKECGS